ncbi:MAG: homing endonuclease associated repeat-containing protein [Gaiellaceae bacterium]
MARRNGDRFNNPEAEVVWAAIEALDVVGQHAVSQRLDASFQSATRNPSTPRSKAAAAVAGLHRAARHLGRTPSVKGFRRLRRDHPELELPSDTNIRRWLGVGDNGGWNDCLCAAGLDAISDGDFTSPLIGRTYRFDDSEVFDALRECASDLGHAPTMTSYLLWARSPEVSDRPGRRPTSYRPFERLGGFRNALSQAGVISANEARYAADGRLLPLRYAYGEQEMKDAILLAAGDLGRSPRSREYDRERLRIYGAALVNQEIRPMPTAAVIRDHFGSWNAALEFAGLPPVDSHLPSFTGGHRPHYTDPQIIEWLRRGWIQVGEPFTGDAYSAWRQKELATGETDIPSLACIARRFGGWNAACRRALPEDYRTGHGRVLRR